MLFQEVLDHLQDGKYLVRDAWESTGEYIVLMPGMQSIWKILVQPTPNAGNYLPLMADLIAEDWKILEKKKEVKEVTLDETDAA